MKKYRIPLIVIVLVSVACTAVFISTRKKPQAVDVLFVGDEKYSESFSRSAGQAKEYFKYFDEGIRYKESNEFQKAIDSFNKALPEARLSVQHGMVYRQLADTYRIVGDTNNELKYAKLVPQYSANPDLDQKYIERARQIEDQILTETQSKL